MKARRLNRRTLHTFIRTDSSGYVVRFGQGKDGYWAAVPNAFLAISAARTLKQVKKMSSEAIQLCLEHASETGWDIPKPEGKPVVHSA